LELRGQGVIKRRLLWDAHDCVVYACFDRSDFLPDIAECPHWPSAIHGGKCNASVIVVEHRDPYVVGSVVGFALHSFSSFCGECLLAILNLELDSKVASTTRVCLSSVYVQPSVYQKG
jgi:hypothetical protein